MSRLKKIISLVIVVIAVASLTTGYIIYKNDQTIIPKTIKYKLTFAVWLPNNDIKIDKSSFKFYQKTLFFNGYFNNGQIAKFAEESTPSAFNDVPDYYQTILNDLFSYTNFSSIDGTVYLAYPHGLNQAAIMNSRGTLMFVTVDKKIPQNTWVSIFNNLKFVYYQ